MYDELHIMTLEKGGYTVQHTSRVSGAYHPFLVAVSTKAELLTWLDLNLESRSPDLVDRRPTPPLAASTKDTDDEISF